MLSFIDNYLLSQITTLEIGGTARKFVSVKTADELIEAIKYSKDNNLEYLVIGGGSNLLVSDEGVEKLIIKNEIIGISTSKGISLNKTWIPNQVRDDKVILSVKSGTILQDLVNYSIEHGLSGLEKLTGIPGTLGGAVYGNAGAYGQTISDHLTKVTTLIPSVIANPKGVAISIKKAQCEFNYRDSIFKKDKSIILEVTFQLEKGDPETLQQEADETLQKRLVKYPKGIKCPGSFFKNIVAESLPKEVLDNLPKEAIVYGKLPAGYLLEQVGAKGDSLGGIEIASYHANLFINNGSGTAQAFYTLAKKYADLVQQKFGITLEPEVQLINLPTI